jgi:transcriptional regulator with XRE-family HTH domain
VLYARIVSAGDERIGAERPNTGEPVLFVIGVDQDDNPRFGQWVRRLRLARTMSTKDLAEQTGISVSFLRMIERGERAPAPQTARDLLEALGAAVEIQPPGDGLRPDMAVDVPDMGETYLLEFKRRGISGRANLEEKLARFLDAHQSDLAPRTSSHIGPAFDLIWAGQPDPLREVLALLPTARPETLTAVLALLRNPSTYE